MVKNFFRKAVGTVIALEVGGLVISYTFWKRLNTNQDFRLHMYKNYYWALEGYYQTGELLSGGDTSIRDFDLNTWKSNGSI